MKLKKTIEVEIEIKDKDHCDWECPYHIIGENISICGLFNQDIGIFSKRTESCKYLEQK